MHYPKIENLYKRDETTHKCGPEFGLRMPEVSQISKWLVLEKVDGMNMRVVWEPEPIANTYREPVYYGRSDKANIPGDLKTHMEEKFSTATMLEAFREDEVDLPIKVVLFGEGYGAGIQSGGHYREDKAFILFDVVVNDHWLPFPDVMDISYKLGIPHAPALAFNATLRDAKKCVALSELTIGPTEGIVCRTDPYLFNSWGQRIMFKYKSRDIS